MKQQVYDYHAKTGYFPVAEYLGYTTESDQSTITDPSVLGSDITYAAILRSNVVAPCSSAGYAQLGMMFNGADLGLDSTSFLVLLYMYEDYHSKTLNAFCVEGDENGPTNTNYFCQPLPFTPTLDGTNERAYIGPLACP